MCGSPKHLLVPWRFNTNKFWFGWRFVTHVFSLSMVRSGTHWFFPLPSIILHCCLLPAVVFKYIYLKKDGDLTLFVKNKTYQVYKNRYGNIDVKHGRPTDRWFDCGCHKRRIQREIFEICWNIGNLSVSDFACIQPNTIFRENSMEQIQALRKSTWIWTNWQWVLF